MKWLDRVHGDPIPWLLDTSNPSVRFGTLVDLLDRPAHDPEVGATWAEIPTYEPASRLLSEQKQDGYRVKRDYYLPKHCGTFWVLSVLADVGLTIERDEIRRGCEFMFAFQRENGAFCRRRRVAGKGIVWDENPGPCTHARILRFLIQFGHGQDPRIRAGIEWLLAAQRDDGMWDCGPPERPGCLRATHDVLSVAALDAKAAAHPATTRGAEAVCGLLMERGMGRYHVGIPWTTLEYPYFGYSVVSTLDALARLGYTVREAKISLAMEYLLSRQLPDGAWPLDRSPYRPPFDIGQPGEPNKWVTLDVLRVIKLLNGKA